MRFTDYLKATVLLLAAVAVALGSASVVVVAVRGDRLLTVVGLGWWVIAAAIGLFLGRRLAPTARIADLLANARAATSLPDQQPARLLLTRLWPLGLLATIAIGIASLLPQVTVLATGYAILISLAWRRQESAVTAIEGRDGTTFYVESTSAFKSIELVMTPGWRTDEWSGAGGGR